MLPIFNEHKFATDMNNGKSNTRGQEDKRFYVKSELLIYTKWLYWNIFLNEAEPARTSKTQNALINFCNSLQLHFNEDVDYKLIEYCVNNAKIQKLRECNPSYITKNEWSDLMSLEDENTRKVYLSCLILAKFNRNNPIVIITENQNKVYADKRLRLTRYDESDILKYAGVKLKTADKKNDNKLKYRALRNLVKAGLIQTEIRFNKKHPASTKVILILTKADLDIKPEDVYLTITDYSDVESYYYYGIQAKGYKLCNKCHRAFKVKSNKNIYCKDCIEVKDKFVWKYCIDCGVRFKTNNEDVKSIRCKKCQYLYKKESQKQWYQNQKQL